METDEGLVPRWQRAIPPTDGIIQSKAALQSLLKMMADFLQRDNPSYEIHFRRIASVEDLLGRDPHCVNGMVPQSSALLMSQQPNIMQSVMFRSASISCMT